jgi:hypothetical protein
MTLQNLKWTKNIDPRGTEPWAYQSFKPGNLFKLAWSKDSEHNANNPQREDLILLRQHGYVTHLVEVHDHKAEREKSEGDFNIYRIVEVLWVIDWNDLPESVRANELFDYQLHLEGGNVMSLDMPKFKEHWQTRGGLTAFQDRVRATLNLPVE